MHGIRKHPRFDYEQAITVRVGENTITAKTGDQSAGGLFIVGDHELLALNTEIQVELHLGVEARKAAYTGLVVHVRRNDDEVVGVGVMLVQMTPDSQQAWIEHIGYVQELCASSARWFSCEHPAALTNGEVEVSVEIRDMSVTGLYVAITSDAFARGDELKLLLISNANQSLQIAVQVVRVRKDSFGRVTAIGLKLVDDSPAAEAWEAHVGAG